MRFQSMHQVTLSANKIAYTPMTDKTYFTSRLARFASKKYQLAFGLAATSESYLLPEELLEGAFECVRKMRVSPDSAHTMGAAAKAEVIALGELLQTEESAGLEKLSWATLLGHPAWIQIMTQCLKCLASMKFDLTEWENSTIPLQLDEAINAAAISPNFFRTGST